MSAKPFRHLDVTLKRAVEGRTSPITWPQKKNIEVLEQFEAWLAKETSDWTTPVAVRTYKQDQHWLIDLEAKHFIANGYEIEDQSTAGSHVNVGRTVTAAWLTGGLSLLVGASRSKGTVTLMFRKRTKRQPK